MWKPWKCELEKAEIDFYLSMQVRFKILLERHIKSRWKKDFAGVIDSLEMDVEVKTAPVCLADS